MKRKIIGLVLFIFCLSVMGFEEKKTEAVQNLEGGTGITRKKVKIGDTFPDEIFAGLIIEELQNLGIPIYNEDDIVKIEDLQKITKIRFIGGGSKLQSIIGAEYLKNLQSITIMGVQLEDYSPILGLKKLNTINFTGTRINSLNGIIEYIKNNSDRTLYITMDNSYITDFSGIDEVRDIINSKNFGRFSVNGHKVKRTTILKNLPHEVDFKDVKFPRNEKMNSAQFESGSNMSYLKAQLINGNLIIKEAGGKAGYLLKEIKRVDGKISYGITTEVTISENHLLPRELKTSFEIEAGEFFESECPFENVSKSDWGIDGNQYISYTTDYTMLNKLNNEQLHAPGSYQLQYKMKKETSGRSFFVPFTVNIKRNPVTTVPNVQYSTHIQSQGWQDAVADGEVSGTIGVAKRLEAIKINLLNNKFLGSIQYSTHVQREGWQGYSQEGQISGTSGQSLRLEAIKIKLTDDLCKKYDIYYQVHAQNFGWLDWAKNGQEAGTTGFGYRLESIRIRLIPKGGAAPGKTEHPSFHLTDPNVKYRAHVQREGWQTYKQNGETSGTSGKALRLEAINIQTENFPKGVLGEIQYRTHVQTYGWQDWRTDNQLSGTSGESKRLEAIQIKLTGDISKHYDVYYRVHAQKLGWMGWARNGQSSGTSGLSIRLEAIQVKLVKKGGNAPGTMLNPFQEP